MGGPSTYYLVNPEEKEAWRYEYYAGLYIAIDQFQLDDNGNPITKRGANFQSESDLNHGRYEIDEIIDKLKELKDPDKIHRLFNHFYDDIDLTSEEELSQFHNNPDIINDIADKLNDDFDDWSAEYRGRSFEEEFEEDNLEDFTQYLLDNEYDLAFGEFRDSNSKIDSEDEKAIRKQWLEKKKQSIVKKVDNELRDKLHLTHKPEQQ